MKNSVVKESLTTAADGKKYRTKFYNLDVIISVGYRVKSQRGTQFRQWVTKRLKDYLVQGYAINEKRLAQKQQEVRHLKDGIRILSRAIEDKAADTDLPTIPGTPYLIPGIADVSISHVPFWAAFPGF